MVVRERYADFAPTLACEKLRELHAIDLVKENLRKLKSAVGLLIPRSQRPARIYQLRNRRLCLGALVTGGIDEETILATCFARISRVGNCFFPLCAARPDELSAITREKAMRLTLRSLASRTCCSLSQTPTFYQSCCANPSCLTRIQFPAP